jgi:hypothetical protein
MAGQFCLKLSGFNRYHTTDPAKQSGINAGLFFYSLFFKTIEKYLKKTYSLA